MRYRDERIKDKCDEFDKDKEYHNLPIGSDEIIQKIMKLKRIDGQIMNKLNDDENEDDEEIEDDDDEEEYGMDNEFFEDPMTDMIYDSPLEELEAGLYLKQTLEELET
jgi:hypothetical protein